MGGRPCASLRRRLRRAAEESFCIFIGPNHLMVRTNQKLIHRSIPDLPPIENRNNLGKCDQAGGVD